MTFLRSTYSEMSRPTYWKHGGLLPQLNQNIFTSDFLTSNASGGLSAVPCCLLDLVVQKDTDRFVN